MKSFINVYQPSTNVIVHQYIEDGKQCTERVHYKPFLGIHTNEKTGWTDIFDKNVKGINFESICEMYQWKKENKDCFEILGDINPSLQFISSRYPDDVPLQINGFKIFNIDIECPSYELDSQKIIKIRKIK